LPQQRITPFTWRKDSWSNGECHRPDHPTPKRIVGSTRK